MTIKIPINAAIMDNDTATMYGYFGMDAVSPKSVNSLLSQANGDDLQVDIASPGGDVFAASEIYSELKSYSGNVNVRVVGLAASAASIIAMAGDHVSISPTAQIMIHKASSGLQGNSNDLEHEAIVLKGIDQSIASTYELRTGLDKNQLLSLMEKETWLSAQEAVDKGFADEIMFIDDNQPQIVNSEVIIPSKEAVNKFMNLLSKSKQNMNKDIIQPKKSPTNVLRQKKLDILLGKKEGI